MDTDKKILDACCSNRMFWLDKKNKDTLYIDIREEQKGYCEERDNFDIKPDMIADYRDLPFKDKTFKHIVWDPPHVKTKQGMAKLSSITTKKYGALHADTWRKDLKKGFEELWRVLDDYGTMNFKFHDGSVKFEDVLKLFHTQPLYGVTTQKKNGKETRWFTFVKVPERFV